MEMRIFEVSEMIKLSTIKENPDNPRVIKDERFSKLVESIKQFPKMMELRPIVVNAENVVLGGNMRLKALKQAGYKEVPNEWIKSASLSDSLKWEKGAAIPEERFFALEYLHNEGIKTWASMEPVIFPDQSLEIMEITHNYIDAYKIGKLNHFQKHEQKFDWPKFLTDAVSIMRKHNKRFYIKKDLLEFKEPDLYLSEDEINMDFLAIPNQFKTEELALN